MPALLAIILTASQIVLVADSVPKFDVCVRCFELRDRARREAVLSTQKIDFIEHNQRKRPGVAFHPSDLRRHRGCLLDQARQSFSIFVLAAPN